MAGGKRKYQSRKKPLRELLKEIDRAADAYVRNGYRDVVGRSYLRTPPSLAELARYHPLSPVATRRGKRVLRKLQSGNDGGYDARRRGARSCCWSTSSITSKEYGRGFPARWPGRCPIRAATGATDIPARGKGEGGPYDKHGFCKQ